MQEESEMIWRSKLQREQVTDIKGRPEYSQQRKVTKPDRKERND